jgi:phosphopantothenoylcysteine decarboxylase/phosphopantothenate--cysteine ligase
VPQVVLGVSGCIAAYKACELLRELQRRDLDVRVVMTEHATHFVAPLTFEALSHHPVYRDAFASTAGDAITHVGWASAADLLLVAPATANILAKLAHGIADDALSTLYLAATAPVIVAPAMNVEMWRHEAVQENLTILRRRGIGVVEPDPGYLACGTFGEGRLADIQRIADVVCSRLRGSRDLDGVSVLVTAGPTREPIDPVRFVSNPSTGRMGFAVAEAARDRGAAVRVVAGPTSVPVPWGVDCVRVTTAQEMGSAVEAHFPSCDVLIMAAAVCDHRPAAPAAHKIKKDAVPAQLDLVVSEDIVARVAREKGRRIVIGFAAETEKVVEHARLKLEAKRLDLIVANQVGAPGTGFGSETNTATLVDQSGEVLEVPTMAKRALADVILDRVVALRSSRTATTNG